MRQRAIDCTRICEELKVVSNASKKALSNFVFEMQGVSCGPHGHIASGIPGVLKDIGSLKQTLGQQTSQTLQQEKYWHFLQ